MHGVGLPSVTQDGGHSAIRGTPPITDVRGATGVVGW
jgi:hypothetical protein